MPTRLQHLARIPRAQDSEPPARSILAAHRVRALDRCPGTSSAPVCAWLRPAPVQLVQENTCRKPVSCVPSAEHDLLNHAQAPATLCAKSSRSGVRTTRSVDSCRPPCLSAAHSTESSRDRQHQMTVEDQRTCRKSCGHTDTRLSTGSVVGSLMRPPWATIPSCCRLRLPSVACAVSPNACRHACSSAASATHMARHPSTSAPFSWKRSRHRGHFLAVASYHCRSRRNSSMRGSASTDTEVCCCSSPSKLAM